METTEVVDLLAEQDWVDTFADGLAAGVAGAFEASGHLSQPLQNALHGTFLGHPLHPVLTDIPLGAWTVAAALDAADTLGVKGVATGADGAIAIGLLGAFGSALTGLADWQAIGDEKKPRKIGAVHAILNIGATILYGASWILRRSGKNRNLAKFLAGTGYGLVGASAYLGGVLVFDQKIGVDHSNRELLPEDWLDVIAESDLLENKPIKAKAGPGEVVLVKQKGVVKALGNSCSHLGGPLCDGVLKGGSIVCPWHGSRFDLSSGKVIDGPATASQPSLETRIVNDRVEVRSR